jgi:predicted RNA-binding protein with PUA-like domain
MKSEPESYSIQDLEKDGTAWWEGVRNYQARNFMRDDMKVGDLVLFYHSNANPPGIAGLAVISKAAAPDQTQFQKKSEYFDPKAKLENPPWVCPQIQFVEKFAEILPLERLKAMEGLSGLLLLQKGQRLSVQPVEKQHFELIRKLNSKASPPRKSK